MTDVIRTADEKFYLTFDVVPPPALVADGAKGDRYTRELSARYVGPAISRLVLEIIKETSILRQGGSLIVTVTLTEEKKHGPQCICAACEDKRARMTL